MNNILGIATRITTFLLWLGLVSGCAMLPGRQPETVSMAEQLAQKIRQTNQDVTTSRGTGNISLTLNGKTEIHRVAWVAQWPCCLRMTLLSSGIPVETIAADGKSVTFVSHVGRHAPHTLHQPNPSLQAILSLPIKLKDIIALLTGKIPLKAGGEVSQCTGEADTSRLIFKNWWGQPTQEIVLNSALQVTEYWRLSWDGGRELKFSFDQRSQFSGYIIAGKTVLTDVHDRRLIFQITSFAPNISLKNKRQLFYLTESG